jgi:hypothetical protein
VNPRSFLHRYQHRAYLKVTYNDLACNRLMIDSTATPPCTRATTISPHAFSPLPGASLWRISPLTLPLVAAATSVVNTLPSTGLQPSYTTPGLPSYPPPLPGSPPTHHPSPSANLQGVQPRSPASVAAGSLEVRLVGQLRPGLGPPFPYRVLGTSDPHTTTPHSALLLPIVTVRNRWCFFSFD